MLKVSEGLPRQSGTLNIFNEIISNLDLLQVVLHVPGEVPGEVPPAPPLLAPDLHRH